MTRSLLPLLVLLAGCASQADLQVQGTDQLASYLSPYSPWAVTSGQASGTLGVSVSSGHDVNNDNLPDALVGVAGWDDGQPSQGLAVLHSGDGTAFDLSPSWSFSPEQAFAFTGGSVALIGDTNDDGFDDLAVGAWQWDDTLSNEGAVFVFLGSATGPAPSPDWEAFGGQSEASFGFALGAGDFNDDGFSDLVVGAPGMDGPATDEGAVLWFAGSSAGLSATPSGMLTGSDLGLSVPDGMGLGFAVAGVGDLDDDGIDDLAVGAPDHDTETGAAALFPGSATGPQPSPSWVVSGPTPFSRFGHSLAGLGSINGDSVSDLAVGAPLASDIAPAQGQVSVYHGSSSGLASSADWSFFGLTSGAFFGAAVNGPGDLDGDLHPDLVVGAPHAEAVSPDQGQVLVFAGTSAGLMSLPVRTISGGSLRSLFGSAISGAGDTNSDGYADLLVGAWVETSASAGEGSATLLLGVPASVDQDNDGYCSLPGGCAGNIPGGDCDDLDPARNPDIEEICDGIDQDCDGVLPLDEQDNDLDGWMICEGDCNDQDLTVHPTAPEQCDAQDHDCDGLNDNGVNPPRFWPDADGDGYGNSTGQSIQSCLGAPAGYAPSSTDCNDEDDSIHPGAAEVTCNAIDEDCSFLTTDVPDRDGDAFTPCTDCQDLGTTLQCGDCDDQDQEINPYMAETCDDGIDQDCDGVDPECALPAFCDEPDNICEDIGCSCSHAVEAQDQSRALLTVLFVALLSLRRRLRSRP